jgi:glycerol kinase
MAKYIGAIDQGTTSSRFILFNRQGDIVSVDQKEHKQIFPRPGWVEHDAIEIWINTLEVIEGALKKAGLTAADVDAIGITNQRETTLLWDRHTGEPLHNALVWQDTRSDELVAEYRADGGQNRFRAETGLPLTSYFSGLKLRWLLDNVAGARSKAESGDALFGTIDSWVVWNLTGGASGGIHLTDVTNASRTQLMNISSCDWDTGMLDAFGIPRALLPRIEASSMQYGEAKVGSLAGTPIAGILGDQQAALVGQTCFAPGEAKNTYGTGSFVLMNTGTEPMSSRSGLLTTVAYRFGDKPTHYALEGSIAMTGSLVQWLRDSLGIISSSKEVEQLARSVDDNGDVYFVPAFSGLYAPYWKENARGVIVGLTRYANKGHIARAALEATAFQTRDVIEAMANDSHIPIRELRVDGGMVANQLLMRFQSDILNVPVVRPKVTETTALGAAYAAGLASGYWRDLDDLKGNWRVERRWTPEMNDQRRRDLYSSWQKAVTRSFDWIN